MWRRSSAVHYSLLVVDSSCGHNWCLCCRQMEQSWRMWWTVCSASLQSQSAEFFRFRCASRLLSCSQSEYCSLLVSCLTVDWVCRGVVVSSGSSPLTSPTVSEQAFGFLVNGGDRGCSCLLPDLARRSALSFPGIPKRGRIPLKDHGAFS